MWYRHSDLSGEWLYRAHVTDDSTWCQYVPSQYINRGISKQTSGSQYQVTDDYWPYYSNGSIDSQTDHGMVYGGGAVTYCTPQDPPPFY